MCCRCSISCAHGRVSNWFSEAELSWPTSWIFLQKEVHVFIFLPLLFQAGYIRIDGSVPSSERIHLVNKFQSDPETRVAILSIQAAGQVLTDRPGTTFFCLSRVINEAQFSQRIIKHKHNAFSERLKTKSALQIKTLGGNHKSHFMSRKSEWKWLIFVYRNV